MRRIILAALITCFAVGTAAAQSCDSKALSADGKPLHGAAKMSFVRKCKRDALREQSGERRRQTASRCGQEQLHDKVHEDRLERLGERVGPYVRSSLLDRSLVTRRLNMPIHSVLEPDLAPLHEGHEPRRASRVRLL